MPISYIQHRINIGYNPQNYQQKLKTKTFHSKTSNMSNATKCLIIFFILFGILIVASMGVGLNIRFQYINSNEALSSYHRNNFHSYMYNNLNIYEERKYVSNHNMHFCSTQYVSYNSFVKYCNSYYEKKYFITNTIKTYDNVLKSNRNKLCHMINGNNKNMSNLNLMLINKRNSNFQNYTNQMQNIIDQYKSNIICVSEANILINNNSYIYDYPNYNVETNKMAVKTGNSRNAIMVNKGINYKRRYDLEDDITCCIWIEVSLGSRKSILIMGGYRQWQLPQFFNDKASIKPKSQLKRYKMILQKWEIAIAEGKETIVLMDSNIDTSDNSVHNNNYKLKHIYEDLLNFLQKHNIVLHNNKYTFFNNIHSPSCIDHIYSNCPLHITNVTTSKNIYSDHAIVTAIYSSKYKAINPRF